MQLALSKNAKREYDNIPKQARAKIKKKLLSLENNPLSGKKLSGELAEYYSIKAWPYRIIYEMNYSAVNYGVSLRESSFRTIHPRSRAARYSGSKINKNENTIQVHKIQHRQGVYK